LSLENVSPTDVGPVATDASEAPYPASIVAWYATFVLAFLYWLSILDRFIISLLVDDIKRDLHLSDVQFGLLQGLGIMGSFTLFGLVFGALADRSNRRRLIYIGVTFWSIATAACGLAGNFWHLLLARIGVGAGEASLNPSATSMLADLFPRGKLTTAMAIYAIGATVGSGTALLLGGAIIELVSRVGVIEVPLLGEIHKWQAVFLIVGLPGILFALTIFAVPEPVRRGRRSETPSRGLAANYLELFRFMRKRPRFFLLHYAGFTLASAIVSGGVSWYPVHVGRTFGWSAGEIGATLGPAFMIAGIIGKLAGGRIVDYMYQRGYRDGQLRWFGICLLVATPIGLYAAMSNDAWTFIIGIAVFMTLVGAMPACALTALNLVTPNDLRGTGVAFWTIVAGLLGGGLGPVLIAWAGKLGTQPSIGNGLAFTIALCCPLGAVCLLLALGPMRGAMAEAEGR